MIFSCLDHDSSLPVSSPCWGTGHFHSLSPHCYPSDQSIIALHAWVNISLCPPRRLEETHTINVAYNALLHPAKASFCSSPNELKMFLLPRSSVQLLHILQVSAWRPLSPGTSPRPGPPCQAGLGVLRICIQDFPNPGGVHFPGEYLYFNHLLCSPMPLISRLISNLDLSRTPGEWTQGGS